MKTTAVINAYSCGINNFNLVLMKVGIFSSKRFDSRFESSWVQT